VSKMWRDPESEVSAEQSSNATGRLVAKVLVGSEWIVVTVPPPSDEDDAPGGDEEDLESSSDVTKD
jgi:hypothetical protein